MTRSRLPHADDLHHVALRRRVARLKVVAWAAAAGAGLAFWSLVGGSVGATTTAPALPAASGQESGTSDLFGGGSTLGVGSGPAVLRSHGS